MKGEVFCLSLVGGEGGNLQVNKNGDNIENKNFKRKNNEFLYFLCLMEPGNRLLHHNNQSKPYRCSGYKIIQRSLRRRKQIRGFLSLKSIKYRIINRVFW